MLPILLLIAVVITVAYMPVDAQYAIVSWLAWLWETPTGRAFLAGAAGSLFAYLAWSTVLWNSFAWSLRKEEIDRADANYQRRKK